MDKKEILEKAQIENDDEGLKNARIKGQKWGIAAFSAVFVIVVVLNTIKDRSNDIPFMFYMAYLAAESVPEFIFTKKKIYLFNAVCGGIAAMLILVTYIIGLF